MRRKIGAKEAIAHLLFAGAVGGFDPRSHGQGRRRTQEEILADMDSKKVMRKIQDLSKKETIMLIRRMADKDKEQVIHLAASPDTRMEDEGPDEWLTRFKLRKQAYYHVEQNQQEFAEFLDEIDSEEEQLKKSITNDI